MNQKGISVYYLNGFSLQKLITGFLQERHVNLEADLDVHRNVLFHHVNYINGYAYNQSLI